MVFERHEDPNEANSFEQSYSNQLALAKLNSYSRRQGETEYDEEKGLRLAETVAGIE